MDTHQRTEPAPAVAPNTLERFRRVWRPLSILVAALIVAGGIIEPLMGLAVPILIAAALVLNLRRRRSFCAGVCPNGNVLSIALRPFSRMKALPAGLASPGTRRMLCGIMLFCVVGLAARAGPEAGALGRVFWTVYAIALAAGTLMGLAFKPRAWCAVCPVGTLQDTLRPAPPTGIG